MSETTTPETKALLREIAEAAADSAVARCLTSMGIDVSNPLQVQRNMAALSKLAEMMEDEDRIQDQVTLRRWRQTVEKMQGRFWSVLQNLAIAGFIALILVGIGHRSDWKSPF